MAAATNILNTKATKDVKAEEAHELSNLIQMANNHKCNPNKLIETYGNNPGFAEYMLEAVVPVVTYAASSDVKVELWHRDYMSRLLFLELSEGGLLSSLKVFVNNRRLTNLPAVAMDLRNFSLYVISKSGVERPYMLPLNPLSLDVNQRQFSELGITYETHLPYLNACESLRTHFNAKPNNYTTALLAHIMYVAKIYSSGKLENRRYIDIKRLLPDHIAESAAASDLSATTGPVVGDKRPPG